MKTILTISALMLLASCTLVDSYMLAKFDSNEYQQVAEIRLAARHAKTECDDVSTAKANALQVANQTEMLEAYTEHLPHNADTHNSAQTLNQMAQSLADHYRRGDKVSSVFCKLKFEGVEHSAELIQNITGARPR
jgi:hypothetical protein